jgi:D-alanyl-D-alanine carboxypeptidase (penicillin-binding protein 5/6)
MRGFELLPVYPKGKVVAYANVYGGAKASVGLVGKDNIDLFVPKGTENCPVATVTYRGPLRPPVKAGQEIGKLNISCGGKVVQQAPLYAEEDVEAGDLMRRSTDALKQLLLGWLP